jgi:hypothetical protein
MMQSSQTGDNKINLIILKTIGAKGKISFELHNYDRGLGIAVCKSGCSQYSGVRAEKFGYRWIEGRRKYLGYNLN